MLIDVSNGIRSIHNKKMMHRDIKPENIIYRTGVYKITDFGTSLAG
jgi:serine/threonine protein kinase